MGNGDGTFQAAVNYAAGTNPQALAVADVNGDGQSDVVAANADSGNISVLLGKGDGTLQAAVNFGAGSGPVFWPWRTSTAIAGRTLSLQAELRIRRRCYWAASVDQRADRCIARSLGRRAISYCDGIGHTGSTLLRAAERKPDILG